MPGPPCGKTAVPIPLPTIFCKVMFGTTGLNGVVFNVCVLLDTAPPLAIVLGLDLLFIGTPRLFLLKPILAVRCGFTVLIPVTVKFFLLRFPKFVTRGNEPPI